MQLQTDKDYHVDDRLTFWIKKSSNTIFSVHDMEGQIYSLPHISPLHLPPVQQVRSENNIIIIIALLQEINSALIYLRGLIYYLVSSKDEEFITNTNPGCNLKSLGLD